MAMTRALIYVAISCLIFNFVVVYFFRAGFVSSTRDKRGRIKQDLSLRDKLPMITFALAVVGITVGYIYYVMDGFDLDLLTIFLHAIAYVLVMTTYDSLVIDLLVIGLWRPKMLKIPEGVMTMKDMVDHVKLTYTFGLVFIIPIILVSTLMFYVISYLVM